MRLRYRTEDPPSVWHTMMELPQTRDATKVRASIEEHCRRFFGSQYFRYGQIHISLHSGADVVAAFSVIPAELELAADTALTDHDMERAPAA